MEAKLDLLDPGIKPARVIWYLAWPTIIEQLLLTFVHYVDTSMVGVLGENATASIAVSSSTMWLVNGLFGSLAVGYYVLVGRNIGAGDIDKAKRIVRQSVLAASAAGVLFTLIMQFISPVLPVWLGAEETIRQDASAYLSIVSSAYFFSMAVVMSAGILRVAGDTRTPLFFNVLTNILNILLNFLLIYQTREITVLGYTFTVWGAGLGVRGAAAATAAAIVVSGSLLLSRLFKKDYPIRISLRDDYKPDLSITKSALRLAAPAAMERITISSGQILMTALITNLGTTALAANYLAVTAEGISYLPAYGFNVAATTLVAQSLGAGNKESALRFARLCLIIGVAMMSFTGIIMYIEAEFLISVFTPVAAVILLGSRVLRVEAFAQPFFAASIIGGGVLRGAGDTKWPFYISIAGMWGVRILTAYVLAYPLGLGLMGAWIGMVADLFTRGMLTFLRFRSKKWLDISVQ
ncbi:MAG: Multidrug resistance protein MdtK [Firmicutes bacterium ADurb.Bin182]|nr:MAG: Multidrug resistance protein MdtK [Firmicutes bacterium ADurb.Bin182]